MINKVSFSILCLFFTLTSFGQDKQIIDKVVAKVGGELILLSDIEGQFDLMRQQQGSIEDEARCSIMENLMATNLLLNQAKLDSIEVADVEVEAQLTARIDNILAYMGGDLNQFESYYGQTVDETRSDFREDLKNQLLTDRMRSKIIADATVTPSEVKDFFKGIPTDSLPYFNSEVEVGEIVYVPKVNETERLKARAKLDEIRNQIVEGADFAELAYKFSDDGGSGRAGGDLGWQKRGTFVTEFEAAAYNLEEGQMSDLVESQFGFHLIELIERRGNNLHCRHILIKPEITEADFDLAVQHLDSVTNLLRYDSLNFSLGVKKFSDEDAQSYNNDGMMQNPQTGNSFWEVGDLDPDLYFTLDTMEVGQYSAPLKFTAPGGDASYRVILLKSRTEPHKANLQQDYSKIKTAALQAKQGNFVNNWIINKMESTFIDVDTGYKTCPNIATFVDKP